MSTQAVGDIPGLHVLQVAAIAHAAATATEYVAMIVMPFDARIREIGFIPCADITGANTNTTHLNAINRGSDGTGSTELANVDFTSGVNGTAGDEKVLSSSLTTAVSEGVVIALQAEKVGTGLAIPAGTFVIRIDGAN